MREIPVSFEEDTKECAPILNADTEEEVMNVTLNEGAIQNTLHTWISCILRIKACRTDIY